MPTPEPIPVPAALAAVPALDDPSVWAFDGDPDGRGVTGSFGVGNGLVFGLIGLDDPVTTLTGATGPTLDLSGGAFGDAAITLDGAPTTQRVQRPRGTTLARTWLDYGGFALSTTDAAPPGLPVVVRHVTVWSLGGAGEATVTVRLARAADEIPPVDPRGLRQDRADRALLVTCEGGTVDGDALTVPVSLAAGGQASFTCAWRFGEAAFDLALDGPALLAEAASGDRAWRSLAATVDAGDPAVADLIDGLLLTMRAQTHPSGVVSPMSRYGRGWLRDAEGPVALYLAAGRPDEAARILDATYASMVAQQAITNSFDPEPFIGDPEGPDAFWAAADFMPGREPAEAPSYAPILAGRLWRVTGELPSEARLSWLRACLDRQVADSDGILPFSGDETWRWPMSFVVGALPEELGGSTASNWLFAAGAEALFEMGEPGYDAEATAALVAVEEEAWSDGHFSPIVGDVSYPPYEDIAVLPWWLGLTRGPDLHLRTTLDALWDGTALRSTTVTGSPAMITGMNPGYTLFALDEAGLAQAEDAFEALPRIATPSGHFEELHDAGLRPLDLRHAADGLGEEVTARFRPWEGGVVGASVMHHLVGAHPDAAAAALELHPGERSSRISGLAFLDGRYDVEIQAFAEGRVVRIERSGGAAPWTVRMLVGEGRRAWLNGVPAGPLVEVTLEEGDLIELIEADIPARR